MDTPNGTATIAKDFEWNPDYDALLEQIALTDSVDTEWARLRDMIAYKIDNNVRQYLAGVLEPKAGKNVGKTPEQIPQSSPLPSSSPFAPSSSSIVGHLGLVIPPFPKRERRRDIPIRTHNNVMDEKEADAFKNQIFEQLNEFDGSPFTIQRLCELCTRPRRHYNSVGKYLRAVERTLLVTSTMDAYPPSAGEEAIEMNASFGDNETLRLATTPVFSPIPFLHDDARRSRSPSPFELAATKRPVGSSGETELPSVDPPPGRQPLGLVDELDDPKPGHLADHPTALTAVTSTGPAPIAPPLSERFVKSSSPESEDGSKDTSETADPDTRDREDAEVEDMVLDVEPSTLEDEDKENRPS